LISQEFNCFHSSVVPGNDADVVELDFDADNSRKIMGFFIDSRRTKTRVNIGVHPIHNPKTMRLHRSGGNDETSAFGGNSFGFAVDAVGANNLMLQQASALVPVDDSGSSVPPATTPKAQRVDVLARGDATGNLTLTFKLTFPKTTLNA
jgi:hypothetical protein